MAKVPPIRRLAFNDNAEFLNAIRNVGSSDYRSRVPEATQARIQDSFDAIWSQRFTRNEFVDALINKIGLTIAHTASFTNPAAKWKRGFLEFGDTVEEIATGLATAKSYEHDRDYLEVDIFGQETPEVQAVYHKINREDYYKITVKDFALKRAFQTSNGLSTFITGLMEAPTTSDQWDEFLAMASLLGEYDRTSGFYKMNVPDIGAIGSDEADAKYMLRRLSESAENLRFLSRDYNAAKMPATAMRDDLELILTPEADAAINVEALAGAFNIDRANFESRKTIIPSRYWNMGHTEDKAQAILTTRDFWVVADSLFETASVVNPVGMYSNYFLHHHQVLSVSPFAPAIMFTTGEGTVITLADTPVTDVEPLVIQDRDGNVATSLTRGETYYITGKAVTTPEGGANDAVRYNTTTLTSPRSYLTHTGYLHVSLDEAAESVTVVATAVDDDGFTEVKTLPVVGDRVVYGVPLEFVADGEAGAASIAAEDDE